MAVTDLQTIEAIHRHLDECPTDWTARLELADWYRDHIPGLIEEGGK